MGRPEDEVSEGVIGACISVHRALGPGLLESAYHDCFGYELTVRGMTFEREVAVPINYRGVSFGIGYRLDLVVEHRLIVELKAVELLLPLHQAQLRTYLKLTSYPVGLLVNFNVSILRHGLRRLEPKPNLGSSF